MSKKSISSAFILLNILVLFILVISKVYLEKIKKEDIDLELKALPSVYPEAAGFSEKKGAPPHYEVYTINEKGEKEQDGLCFLSTEFAPEVKGYAGKIKILIGMDRKGRIRGIKVLSHNETPSYTQALQDEEFTGQFKGFDHRSKYILGEDLDGITRATVTSMAVAAAIENSVKYAANKFYQLEVEQKERSGWKHMIANHDLYVNLLFFVLVIYFYLKGMKSTRYFIMAGAVLYFGFIKLNFISVIGLINIFTGKVPEIVSSLPWYLLFVFVFISTVFLGRIYCGWICPFGGIQDIIGKISPFRVKIKNTDEQKARSIKYYLFILTVGAVFFTGNTGFTNIEPFNAVFGLKGDMFIIIFLAFILFSSLFIFRFWCRYLCGVGAFLSLISHFSIFSMKIKDNCIKCGKCENICPMEACDTDIDTRIDNGECIQCNICREECGEKAVGN